VLRAHVAKVRAHDRVEAAGQGAPQLHAGLGSFLEVRAGAC